MKILHCCLAQFYIDNYSYQENVFPRMHKLQGNEVAILASTETYINNAVLGYLRPNSYHTKDSIPITRLPYSKWLPHNIMKKLRIYKGITEFITAFNPDIIFLHDCQFISITEFVSFAKNHPNVKIYIDGHTDFINSGRNWISKNILHRIIYKWCAKKIEPYTKKFYGTLPIRVDFFKNIYGISPDKVELLVLGADDTVVDLSKRNEIRSRLRGQLDIRESDFVIVTGGKIEIGKNIHILMKAVRNLQKKEIKLVVFGVPNKEMKSEIDGLAKSNSIKYVGWIPSEKAYDYFLAADLAFFPGTHSVLWEQAVGVGLPCIFKKWEGMQHIDVGGNCLFIENANVTGIQEKILLLYERPDLLLKMKNVALEKGIVKFSYYEIAKKAIEE